MVRRQTPSPAPAPAPIVVDDEAMLDELEDTGGEDAPVVQAAVPPPPKAGKTGARVTMPGHKGVKTLKILLEDNPDIPPTGQFIGHNGVSYMLKPGVWVDVPLPIIEILNNAVQQVPDRDPATNQIIGWRDKLRYPYRVAPGSVAT